jgi:6-phosphogluconolactonase
LGRQLQTVSTEPPGHTVPQSIAEIAVHPSGKLLYVSNCGHISIVQFRIDQASGQLGPTKHVVRSITPVAIVFSTRI